MPRLLDLECVVCGERFLDIFVAARPDTVIHADCGGTCDEILLAPRTRPAWREQDSVVVYRDAAGKIRYPPRNDAPTPPGCERVTMRSLAEVRQFERANHVSSEAMNYDRGTGRGADDLPPVQSATPERERYARFLQGWGKR